MNALLAVLALCAGLVAGLLVNIVATRLAANKPLLGRLHCTRSAHPLTPRQVMPVAGYLLQRGQCSTCGRGLSLSYPATELAAGLLFLALFLFEGWGVGFLFHAVYVTILVLVLVLDWKHRDIYLSVMAVGWAIALLGSLFLPGVGLVNALIGAGVAGGFFAVAYGLAKLIFPRIEEPLGAGDVLLALLMGLMLGFPNVVGALLIGPLLAGAASILLLVSHRSGFGDFMPYGVALCAASILFLVYPAPFVDALRLPALMSVLSGFFGNL